MGPICHFLADLKVFSYILCLIILICVELKFITHAHDFYKNHYIQIHFEKYLTTIRDNLRFSNNISPNLLGLGNFPQKT